MHRKGYKGACSAVAVIRRPYCLSDHFKRIVAQKLRELDASLILSSVPFLLLALCSLLR